MKDGHEYIISSDSDYFKDNNIKVSKYHQYYMDIAKRAANMSHCKRKMVGAVAVKENRIISDGWNGQPSGMNNCCESHENETLPTVLHAESNLISKISKSHESSDGCTVYCTLSCCIDCAKLMYQAGITEFIYLEDYRTSDGLEFLAKRGVTVSKISEETISKLSSIKCLL